MLALIHSEWIKFRSVRSTLITLFLAGGLVVLVAVIAAAQADDDLVGHAPHLSDLTGGVMMAALIFGVLGVQVLGQEYRFNTIRPTFTAMPHRGRVLAAKLVVVTGACGAISVVMLAATWLVGSVMLDSFVVDGMDRRVALGIVAFSMGWSALGMGVGAIVRQPIAGILILLTWALVAEDIIEGLLTPIARWRPVANGLQVTYPSEGSEQAGLSEHLFSVLGGALYFFAVAAVIWVIGAALANRRDA